MRSQDANEKNISKISDIRRYNNNFKLGCEHDFFARPNGYSLLKNPQTSGYGISFKEVRLLQRTETYSALDDNELDIIDGFTTDPQIRDKHYIRLKDDEHRFGIYYASLVARKNLLETCPTIGTTLNLLNDQISEEDMCQMIQEADSVDNVKERSAHLATIEKIANRFLEQKQLPPINKKSI